MGVISTLEEILALTFQVPIVQDITQTKVERAIGYRITSDGVRTVADSRQTHRAAVEITLRAENGYDSLGWLSAKLASGVSSGDDWRIIPTGGDESVDYVDKGEILISLSVVVQMTIHHDQVKEKIKSINLEAVNNG